MQLSRPSSKTEEGPNAALRLTDRCVLVIDLRMAARLVSVMIVSYEYSFGKIDFDFATRSVFVVTTVRELLLC